MAEVTGEHFHKDPTASAEAGTGSYSVRCGHDQNADELSFGPFPASVVLAGAAAH